LEIFLNVAMSAVEPIERNVATEATPLVIDASAVKRLIIDAERRGMIGGE